MQDPPSTDKILIIDNVESHTRRYIDSDIEYFQKALETTGLPRLYESEIIYNTKKHRSNRYSE
jgi:hypothetical protein